MEFSELVDIDKLRVLCESFTTFTGMVTAVVDLDGNVLIATGWQDICTRFHRFHPTTRAHCLESDTAIGDQIEKGQRYNVYKCKNGLIDVAVPIIIDGEHIADFFTGQFFFEAPDEDYFIHQAEKYGFDKASYLAALSRVPIASEAKIRLMMEFLSNLVSLVGETAFSKQHIENTNKLLQQEITEHKLAEDALRESEANYRQIVDTAYEGILTFDNDENIAFINARMVSMLGYNMGEVLGKSFTDFLFDEDLSDHKEKIANRRAGISEQYERRFRHKNGQVIWTIASATPIFDSLNRFQGSFAMFTDITDRKHAVEALQETEEKYRILVEKSVVGVYTIQDEKIVYANPQFSEIIGYSPEEMTDGRVVYEFIAPESLELVKGNVRRRLTGEEKAAHYQIKAVHKNGNIVDVELYGSLTHIKGKPTIIGTALDVTERVQAEQHKRELEKQLDDQKRLFYRDTILSVTDGKLDIVDPPIIRTYLANAKLKIDVINPLDVTSARHTVECYCCEAGLDGDELSWFMTGLGEAMTNAIKHGKHGRVYCGMKNGVIWAGVSDRGSGIDSLMLPRATLLKGFSTKPSLGLGYSIMLDVSDRVLLKTGKYGTTVILIKNLRESKATVCLNQLPDIWDRVVD